MRVEFSDIVLENGLTLSFIDQTNRYFGDFHRVCIEVSLVLPQSFRENAGTQQSPASHVRTLEKMGVPTVDLETVRKDLIDAFLATSRKYLERPDYPGQLVLKIQQKKKTPVFLNRV